MLKRILITLGVLTALLLLAVGTLPWWLGGVVRHYATPLNVAFSSYENVGYGRWALENVVWRDAGIVVEASRIEGPHPLLWWWKKSESSAVLVDGLKVDLRAMESSESESKRAVTGPRSAVSLFHQIKPWLPSIELSTGGVTIADEQTIVVEGVALVGFDLSVAKVRYAEKSVSIALRLNDRFFSDGQELGGGDLFEFEANGVGENWNVEGKMVGRRNQLELQGQWLDQAFSVHGVFVSDRWIPDSGRFEAENWLIDAAEIGLSDFYQEISGSMVVNWHEGRFNSVQLRMTGEPPEAGDYPPLAVDLRGSASMESAEIQRLYVSTPGLSLTTDEPFEISRESVHSGAVSELRLSADLALLPMIKGTGTVTGKLRITTREQDWPSIDFDLVTNQISLAEAPAVDGQLKGQVAWPQWEVSSLTLRDGEGSEVRLQGHGDGVERSIERGTWAATVLAKSLAPWVKLGDVSWSEIKAEGAFSGTLDLFKHEGSWTVGEVTVPKLKPIAVAGRWTGQNKEAAVTAQISAGWGKIDLEGALTAESFVAERLEIRHEDGVVLALSEPTTVRWADEVSVDLTKWIGTGISGEVRALTASSGQLGMTAKSPSFDWVRDWWAEEIEFPRIESLALEVDWADGPVTFSGDLLGHMELAEVGDVRVAAKVEGNEAGLRIEQLEFGQNDRVFAQVSGSFPGTFNLGTAGVFTIDESAAIDLTVLVAPNPAFWKAVGESQHVTVSRPDIAVTVKGTWAVPQATGSIAVGSVQVGPEFGGKDWPKVSNLSVTLKADGNGVRIENGGALIEGQEVRWSGRLPVAESDWERLRAEPLSYLREQGAGRIEVPQANLATVAKFVPEYLVPIGQVSLELTFSPGAKIDGRLQLSEAVSRPLGPLGVLQEIEADIIFSGREIQVNRLNALMGGQPVRITGTAAWEEGKRPELDLRLKGTNLPLMRQTGLLLRGDLDLRVSSDDDGAGKVAGVVNLHDGLMLADVRSLVPTGGTERRESRPPYFSVTVEPFAEWDLDLAVKGRPFMRLRTPVLTGEASIDVRLDGTLRTPRAIGEITLDRGEVKLPFARFEVEEGQVSLTEAQPYQPKLSFIGTGKRFGYDLTMELTGSASDPQLRLSSEPFLPAADVVLLVMAGVAPQEEFAYTQGERAMKLGMYFGQEVVSDLLGFEGDGKLALTTGEKLSRRGKETYRVGYDLTGRWTVTGEYDEFDHYNAGLKWLWLPKRETATEKEAMDAPK